MNEEKIIINRGVTNFSKIDTTVKQRPELTIHQKYLEMFYYSYDLLNKYPKKEQFALTLNIRQTLQEGLSNLIYGIKIYNKHDKLKYLRELNINLTLLKLYIRISNKEHYITIKNYETWSNHITDISNILGGWINSCQKK